jgi:hypothetical protein
LGHIGGPWRAFGEFLARLGSPKPWNRPLYDHKIIDLISLVNKRLQKNLSHDAHIGRTTTFAMVKHMMSRGVGFRGMSPREKVDRWQGA